MTWNQSGTIFDTFPMPAGDQTDELVLEFPAPPNDSTTAILTGFDLSCEGPVFDWSLYFQPAPGAGAENVVIVDSRLAASMPISVVAPIVVNLTMNCNRVVPRNASTGPMALYVTTTNKTGAGNLRLRWCWADP